MAIMRSHHYPAPEPTDLIGFGIRRCRVCGHGVLCLQSIHPYLERVQAVVGLLGHDVDCPVAEEDAKDDPLNYFCGQACHQKIELDDRQRAWLQKQARRLCERLSDPSWLRDHLSLEAAPWEA